MSTALKFFSTTSSPLRAYVFLIAFLIYLMASSFGITFDIAKKQVCKMELMREPMPVSLATLDALITYNLSFFLNDFFLYLFRQVIPKLHRPNKEHLTEI